MRRTRSLLLVAGLLAPLGAWTPAASAADPVLTVSATSGAAGDAITISGTECGSGDGEAFVRTKLIVGTAPNERIAGFAESWDGEDDAIVLPSWLDADEPAVLEAECLTYDDETDAVVSAFSYDPVAFDVLPGAGEAQVATFSRTAIAVGQVIAIEVTGCPIDLEDEDDDGPFLDLLAFAGDDPSGRSFVEPLFLGGGVGSDGTTVTAYLVASDESEAIEPGSYVVVPMCGSSSGRFTYEPQVITIAANPSVGDIELSVAPGTAEVTFAGGGCLAGDVQISLLAIADDLFGPGFDEAATTGRGWTGAGADSAGRWTPAPNRAAGIARAEAEDEDEGGFMPPYLDELVAPDGDGSWAVAWDAGITAGDVYAFAQCGDPLADGFIYRQLSDRIDVPEAPPVTVPPTPPAPPAPTPPPANALPGVPAYAG